MSYSNKVKVKINYIKFDLERVMTLAVRKLNNNFNVISENLRKYRKMRHLSQAGLARKLNLLGIPAHKNDICLIEANRRTVKDYELWGIIKALDISFEELMLGIENKIEGED